MFIYNNCILFLIFIMQFHFKLLYLYCFKKIRFYTFSYLSLNNWTCKSFFCCLIYDPKFYLLKFYTSSLNYFMLYRKTFILVIFYMSGIIPQYNIIYSNCKCQYCLSRKFVKQFFCLSRINMYILHQNKDRFRPKLNLIFIV